VQCLHTATSRACLRVGRPARLDLLVDNLPTALRVVYGLRPCVPALAVPGLRIGMLYYLGHVPFVRQPAKRALLPLLYLQVGNVTGIKL